MTATFVGLMVSTHARLTMQTDFVYTMANKPLQFILTERKLNVGKAGEKTVQIDRKSVV
mgnify:CR=1 FL=1